MKAIQFILFFLVLASTGCERAKKQNYEVQKDAGGNEVVISDFLREYKKLKLEFVQLNASLPEDLNNLNPTSRENLTQQFKEIRIRFESLAEISDKENFVLQEDLDKCEEILSKLNAK